MHTLFALSFTDLATNHIRTFYFALVIDYPPSDLALHPQMGFHWVHRTATPTTPPEAEHDKEELPQEAQNAAHALQHVGWSRQSFMSFLMRSLPLLLFYRITNPPGGRNL